MAKDRLVFATFFPVIENVHLTKDIGTIPYVLYRDYDYDSYLITYRADHPYLTTEVKGLKPMFIDRGSYHKAKSVMRKVFGEKSTVTRIVDASCTLLDALPVLLRHGKKIDVLQLYHFKDESMLVGYCYKLLNKNGILYLKLDLGFDTIKMLSEDPAKLEKNVSRIYRMVKFDVISVETKSAYEFITTKHRYFREVKDRVHYIPNGVDVRRLAAFQGAKDSRQNVVLFVGRVGNKQKATEVLLEAFAGAAREFPGWQLVMIGQMEPSFETKYADFLASNADIKDRIRYLGFLESREHVYEYFARAKIFGFPSEFESFGLAIVEAGFFGDVVLGSDIPSTIELTDDGRLGYLCPVNDVGCFTKKLMYMMSHDEEISKKSVAYSTFVKENYDWKIICGRLDQILRETIAGNVR